MEKFANLIEYLKQASQVPELNGGANQLLRLMDYSGEKDTQHGITQPLPNDAGESSSTIDKKEKDQASSFFDNLMPDIDKAKKKDNKSPFGKSKAKPKPSMFDVLQNKVKNKRQWSPQ